MTLQNKKYNKILNTNYFKIGMILSVAAVAPFLIWNQEAFSAVVPDKVTGLMATAISSSQIDLSWIIPGDGGSSITGYKIERAIGTNDTAFIAIPQGSDGLIAINSGNDAWAQRITLTQSETIEKIVIFHAFRFNGVLPSTSVNCTRTAGEITVFAHNGTGFVINGTDQNGAGKNVLTDLESPFADTVNDRTYILDNPITLAAGTYDFGFRYTGLQMDTPIPNICWTNVGRNLAGGGNFIGDQRIESNFNWITGGTSFSNWDSNFFDLSIELHGAGNFTTIVPDTASTATTYSDTGLSPLTNYFYRVSAINAIGTGMASNTANATTFAVPVNSCNGLTATIVGTSGDDIIDGTSGDDVIVGLEGNDIIDGKGGDDTICGGDGDDIISGNAGSDTIFGDAGIDQIFGNDGTDEIHGGADIDYIEGGFGNDTIFGDDDNDVIFGKSGSDTIDGGNGDDLISGDDGSDTINGGEGNDRILGSGDGDTIYGDAGNDVLLGEAGSDSLDGGDNEPLGVDVCISGGQGGDTTVNCEVTI